MAVCCVCVTKRFLCLGCKITNVHRRSGSVGWGCASGVNNQLQLSCGCPLLRVANTVLRFPPTLSYGSWNFTLCLFSLPVCLDLTDLQPRTELRLAATHLQLLSGQLVAGLSAEAGLGRKAMSQGGPAPQSSQTIRRVT